MDLQVKTEKIILKPIDRVFTAIIEPKDLVNYFITMGSHTLEEGKTVIWRWDDVGAELPIHVKKVDKKQHLISFVWSASGVETMVEFTLEALDENKTLVKVKEDGWDYDQEGIQRLCEQTQGWVDMVTCMKAYLEFGINLRKGNQL